ncbi:MAG TPA: hypothetical protein V6D19_12445 [Stenomitos sp.]
MPHKAAMFIQELSPIFQEFVQKPVAFMGGFVSGLMRLNLSDDPVKTWLEREIGVSVESPASNAADNRSNGTGPQSISID